MYGGRSSSPTAESRETGKEAQEASSWSSYCRIVVRAINQLFSVAFIPLLIFSLYCIVKECVQVDDNFSVTVEALRFSMRNVTLAVSTFFCGIIWFAQMHAGESRVTEGKAGSDDTRIGQRHESVSPHSRMIKDIFKRSSSST